MADHVFYTNIDRKLWITQPNFVRWRHSFRSPRSSYKFNEEASAFLYDVFHLYNKYQNIVEKTDNAFKTLWNGGSAGTYPLLGLDHLIYRVDKLRARIKNLEQNG